ncbi:MAG: carbohydrate kinase [Clostridia bacterium]
MNEICCMGEVLIDFTPAGISENGNTLFERNPGGGPANVAVAASVLGAPAMFMGKVGNDEFGRFLERTLKDRNVDTSGLVHDFDSNTTLAFVQLDKNGNRSFSFYRSPGADMMYSEADIDYGIIDRCGILHFSTVSMTQEPSRTATRKVVEYAREKGRIISFDPNLRELLWDSLEEAKTVISSMLQYADILKISKEELEFLTGKDDVEEATEEIFNKGIGLIFSTLGPDGCYYRHRNGRGHLQTYNTKVVDTTGSGDAFAGAVLYKTHMLDKHPSILGNGELYEIADFANAAGACAATGKGAIPSMPGLEQIEKCRRTTPLL